MATAPPAFFSSSAPLEEAAFPSVCAQEIWRSATWPLFERLGWSHAATRVVPRRIAPPGDVDTSGHLVRFVRGSECSFFVGTEWAPSRAAAYKVRRAAWSADVAIAILSTAESLHVYDARALPVANDDERKGCLLALGPGDDRSVWSQFQALFSRENVESGSLDRWLELPKHREATRVGRLFASDVARWHQRVLRALSMAAPKLDPGAVEQLARFHLVSVLVERLCEARAVDVAHALALAEVPPRTEAELDALDLPTFDGGAYDFATLPADVLGVVHEVSLASRVELDNDGRSVIVASDTRRRRGGVFYTPRHVVDFIVRQTLAPLVEGKPRARVEGLRIVDPACGSGSFLLGAYEFLLAWYLNHDWVNAPRTDAPNSTLVRTDSGYRLAIAERKRIASQLHGVDIDEEAVNLARISLALKVLEGELEEEDRPESVGDAGGFRVRAGHALLTPRDFLAPHEAREGPARTAPSLLPANGDSVGGAREFDAVLGNPPYGASLAPAESHAIAAKFSTFRAARDVFVAFVEHAIELLRPGGRAGLVLPSSWLGGPAYADLRRRLLAETVGGIVELPHDVFADAYVDTVLVWFARGEAPPAHEVATFTYPKRARLSRISLAPTDFQSVCQASWGSAVDPKFVLDPVGSALLGRLRDTSVRVLGDLVTIRRGVRAMPEQIADDRASANHVPLFEGDVYRHELRRAGSRWVDWGAELPERPKEFTWFEGQRILLRRLVNRRGRLMAAMATETFVTKKDLYTIKPRDPAHGWALVALLDAKLWSFLYGRQTPQAQKDDFPQVTIRDLARLPLPSPEAFLAVEPELAARARELSEVRARIWAGCDPGEASGLERRAAALEAAIDLATYGLYALTEHERGEVERAIAGT